MALRVFAKDKTKAADDAPPFLENAGHCVICDGAVTFRAKGPWLRDEYRCSECDSIPRERALMWCIERFYPQWRTLRIHESSPSERGASSKLARHCKNYVATQYYRGVAPGAKLRSGCRCEDLEHQTFPDESFDLVISQDVMEHVFNPAKAFQEIARTLRPRGAHIFTTPLVNRTRPSQVRATQDAAGEVVHHFPPDYHGNPIDASGSLVTMHWGYDISEYILRHSGLHTSLIYIDDLARGIRAEFNEVLVSRKV